MNKRTIAEYSTVALCGLVGVGIGAMLPEPEPEPEVITKRVAVEVEVISEDCEAALSLLAGYMELIPEHMGQLSTVFGVIGRGDTSSLVSELEKLGALSPRFIALIENYGRDARHCLEDNDFV